MSLQEQLNTAMKAAMKAKDSLRLNAIRLVKTAIKNKEIEARKEFDDQDVIGVLSSLVKQRRESAQVYRDNGRVELAEKEEQELAVIQEFLPRQLGEEEIKAL
ncbi:MAG: GatB/YqeY domain-containing protein, partial [Desulfuromonadaceae bacterium]